MRYLTILLFFLVTAPAYAQITNAGVGYVAVVSGTANGGVCDTNRGTCVSPSVGIPLDYFASSESVSAFEADIRRSRELAILAAALKDAIPNAGDTYALSFNAATDGGALAGAIGLGINLSSTARFNLNYGRSATQNIVTGGITLSMR